MRNLAADIKVGPLRGIGPLGIQEDTSVKAPFVFGNTISTVIGVITVVGVIWFIVQLLTGAISIIGSGGDKNKLEQARAKIASALTGLVVIVAGIFIINLVATFLGIPSVLNVAQTIIDLGKQ